MDTIRKEITGRYYKTLTYQEVDRVPDMEFGFWIQTIRRWLNEGMAIDLSSAERASEFPAKMKQYFEFEESDSVGIDIKTNMNPAFEEKILKDLGDAVLKQGADGQIAECYPDESENCTIHYISFPVKTPEDWASMKERFRLNDPARKITNEDLHESRLAIDRGGCIHVTAMGPYGRLREWMGMENLSIAFFEERAMVHDMAGHWTELLIQQLQALPDDLPIDEFHWWEDLAFKNGPLVGPAMFREFLQPCYHLVMAEVGKHGCGIGSVDTDGNPHDLVHNWLEEGVNLITPMEYVAGADVVAFRTEFGRDLRMLGGIAKEPVRAGGKAIDLEMERIKPVLDMGGYIPHLDHAFPSDIPYDNFRYYLNAKRKLIGK